ncbi:MAG: amidase [Sphingomonadales bacterium]|nr:amidase [Sphingomonadales bacterium]
MDVWHRLGTVGLKLAYLHGQSNPVAVAGHMLERIDRLNPRINVISQLDRDSVLRAAHGSASRFQTDMQRPLEGVPMAVSSNIAVRGLENRAGMEARRGMVCSEDAAVVTQLREAGAILLGTLAMDEAGVGCTGDNPWSGRTYNPHGDGLSPAGAMGGCGAAVAAGFALAAIGGDTLGATRVPAAACGVFALRPSRGAMDLDGLLPLNPSFDALAICTRSMDDLSAILSTIAPPDLNAALNPFEIKTLYETDDLGLNEDVAAHYGYALSLLPEVPTDLDLPAPPTRIGKAARNYTDYCLAAELAALGEERCALLSDAMQRRIERVLSQNPELLDEDMDALRLAGQAMREQIGADNLLLTPAMTHPADMHGADHAPSMNDLAILADVSGLPAIVFPVGMTGGNLPLSLQLIGPMGSEALLIAQARMLTDRIRGYTPPQSWW